MRKTPMLDGPPDPLYHTVPLPHRAEIPIMGVSVRYESNRAEVITAVEATLGAWAGLRATPELIDPQEVRVRLIVHEGDEGTAGHTPIAWRLPDPDRLLIHTSGSLGFVDIRNRDSVVYLTEALLADEAHFNYSILHTATFPLVDSFDRYPIHAAMIGRGPVGLLLAGPSGTGKSTLAFEAHRSGLNVLTDDVSHVQMAPVFRVWGEMPGHVYLTPKARARFPELAGHVPSLNANGVEKVFVQFPYAWSGPNGWPPMATTVAVCLLTRDGGRARAAPATPDEIAAFLRQGLGVAQVMLGPRLDHAIASVAKGGGWKLSLSDDSADAIPLLADMVNTLEERGRGSLPNPPRGPRSSFQSHA